MEAVVRVVKKTVPIAKEVAEEVVVTYATLADMGMEMKRGMAEWPVFSLVSNIFME